MVSLFKVKHDVPLLSFRQSVAGTHCGELGQPLQHLGLALVRGREGTVPLQSRRQVLDDGKQLVLSEQLQADGVQNGDEALSLQANK